MKFFLPLALMSGLATIAAQVPRADHELDILTYQRSEPPFITES